MGSQSNLESYRNDLDKLVEKGILLHQSMQYELYPDRFKEAYGDKSKELIKKLVNVKFDYQSWYSECQALIKQLLPDRLDDFVKHYEKPKSRKDISYENYRIEDYLQGLNITKGYNKVNVVGPDAALPHLEQQRAILDAVYSRFDSTLFDIKQIVQADLFDSELASAHEILNKGFIRAAGAIAGVVLEKHLAQVADNHSLRTRKKHPSINDYNEMLKIGDVIDIPQWRNIQRLGDIRNLCDHAKNREPEKDEVQELISGVEKFSKTLF